MGKPLLLLIAGAILTTTLVLFNNVGQGQRMAQTQLRSQQSDVLAREIAYTGMSAAEGAVFADYATAGAYTGESTSSGTYQNGDYTVDVTISGDTVQLKSVGTVGTESHTVFRTYVVNTASGSEPPVPEFMEAAMTTNGNFIVDSNMSLLSSDVSQNANVRANGNIEIKSGSVSIRGFGYHKGNAWSTNGQSLSTIFNPYVNPDGLPSTQQVAQMSIPYLDVTTMSSLATWSTGSNKNISGTINLGTKASPAIWYIGGNLITTGNVTFNGYGVMLVAGNIEIYHNVTLSGATTESTLGFYTNGDILVKNANLNTAGQWYLNGNVTLDGSTNFTGTITNWGNLEFNKQFNATYRPASSALTQPFWPQAVEEESDGLTLISSREWASH
jgi:hypothetical protein